VRRIDERATCCGYARRATHAGDDEYIIPWFAEFPEQAARKYVPGFQHSVFRTFRYGAAQLPWLRR